eukprot:COSAG05_NODE_446_length_9772_cov_117.012923_9_plen_163_part_00
MLTAAQNFTAAILTVQSVSRAIGVLHSPAHLDPTYTGTGIHRAYHLALFIFLSFWLRSRSPFASVGRSAVGRLDYRLVLGNTNAPPPQQPHTVWQTLSEKFRCYHRVPAFSTCLFTAVINSSLRLTSIQYLLLYSCVARRRGAGDASGRTRAEAVHFGLPAG